MKQWVCGLLCIMIWLVSAGCGTFPSEPPAESSQPISTPVPTPSPDPSELEPGESSQPEEEKIYEEDRVPTGLRQPAEEFAGGSGTQEDPFRIATAEHLVLLVQRVNSGAQVTQQEEEGESGEKEEPLFYKDACYLLVNDVDLNDTGAFASWETVAPEFGWTPIGTGESGFSGQFDGGGHSIRGLYLYEYGQESKQAGLFGVVDGGTICNLTLSRSSVTVRNGKEDVAGGLAGLARPGSVLKNCTVEDSVTVTAENGGLAIGGLTGEADSITLQNCKNAAVVSQTGTVSGSLGGLAGLYTVETQTRKAVLQMEQCANSGEILAEGTAAAGGLIGTMRAGAEGSVKTVNIKQCQNSGSVQTMGAAGGLVAVAQLDQSFSVTVFECENRSMVSGNLSGGLFGEAAVGNGSTLSLKSCTSNGEVKARYTAGGVAAQLTASSSGTLQVSQCQNGSPVSSQSGRAAGILSGAVLAGDSTCQILSCSNYGTVTAQGGVGASGVVGILTMRDSQKRGNTVSVYQCRNTAPVTMVGTAKTGELSGILGRLETGSEKDRAKIAQCSNSGNMQGGTACIAGGILARDAMRGQAAQVEMTDCCNLGNITVENEEDDSCVGGLAGQDLQVVIKTSYSAGVLTQKTKGERMGGLVGEMVTPDEAHPCKVENCYYLNLSEKAISITPLADGSFRSDTAVNVYALGASDFPQQKKFVGFDFETVWQISGTYPTLRALT